jgi:hypothetical protein
MQVQFPPAAPVKDRDSNNGKNKPPKVRFSLSFPSSPFTKTDELGERRQTYPSFDLHTYLEERDPSSSTLGGAGANSSNGANSSAAPPAPVARLASVFAMNSTDGVPLARPPGVEE